MRRDGSCQLSVGGGSVAYTVCDPHITNDLRENSCKVLTRVRTFDVPKGKKAGAQYQAVTARVAGNIVSGCSKERCEVRSAPGICC